MSHAELEDLLGAYALDAVDGDERDAVEVHLLECPRCRAEVAEHRETAAVLAHTGARAPDELWERVASALEEAPPELDLAPVLPMRGRTSRRLRVAVAVAAVAAAVIAGLGVRVVDQDHRIGRLQNALEQGGLRQAALSAAADPHVRRVVLRSSGVGAPAMQARAVVLPDGSGFLVENNLPRLPAGRTYQLWAVVGDQRISAGLLGRRPGIVAFGVAPNVGTLAVTEEHEGGVVASINPPLVLGRLPRV